MGFYDNSNNYEKKESTWVYSDPESPVYAQEITGTLIETAQRQERDMVSGKGKIWEDSGKPRLQERFAILRDDAKGNGVESNWFFRRKSSGGKAVEAAAEAAGLSKISDILGKRVRISTPGLKFVQGQNGNAGYNVRIWEFQILGQGNKAAVRGVITEPELANVKPAAEAPYAQSPTSTPQSQYQQPPQQPVYNDANIPPWEEPPKVNYNQTQNYATSEEANFPI